MKLYQVNWKNPKIFYPSLIHIKLIFAENEEQAKLIYKKYYNSSNLFPKMENIVAKEISITAGILTDVDIISEKDF